MTMKADLTVFLTFENRHVYKGYLPGGNSELSGRYWIDDGVATISRLLKIIGLFFKRALWKRLYSAKETYNDSQKSGRY